MNEQLQNRLLSTFTEQELNDLCTLSDIYQRLHDKGITPDEDDEANFISDNFHEKLPLNY